MNSSQYFAVFYVSALYYLPQFLPVADEMKRRGLTYAWIFSDDLIRIPDRLSKSLGENIINDTPENISSKADFIIFGNTYNKLNSVSGKTVLIYHGIGTKACYYESALGKFDIRFIEGEYRKKELDSRSPNAVQERPVVGFSKLDPTVSFSPADREKYLLSLGLDPARKTVLYAPTFYPSSIELMDTHFPDDCRDLNLIIKPHQFSFRKRYKRQLRIMEKWNKRNNVYLAKPEDFNLLPFFTVSDVMISDESSAIFEFAALGKPVVRNRFVKLRFSYRLFPWKLKKRMDSDIERYSAVARDSHDYNETIRVLREVLDTPVTNANDIERYSKELMSDIDGKVSERIVDYLVSHKKTQ